MKIDFIINNFSVIIGYMLSKMPELKNTVNKLDPKLGSVFLPWAIRHPKYLRAFFLLCRTHKKTKKLRDEQKRNGLKVPPFLILSITSKCNLACSGCYAAATGTVSHKKKNLDISQWKKIIEEANELGVFSYVIAGGEPFLYPDLLSLCEDFKDRLFIIVTNGTAIQEKDFDILKRLSNVVVLVSTEGGKLMTDTRRGKGTYEKVTNTLERLNKNGTLTGISVTITKNNFRYWMDESKIDKFISDGLKIGTFIEYIPISKKENKLMLTKEERERFRSKMLEYREKKPIYIIHSPGDEEFFGGCVSAGRGFAHVTPEGDLTPCPVSNVATHNLTKSSLREALESQLFKEIRDNEHLLETDGMPCALFAHPEEVDKLAESVGAYRTI